MVVYATNMQLHNMPKNLPKTLCKNSPKTSQKPPKNLVGKNPAKIFYENINTKTSKISKNFLTLPNILNKNKKL